MHKFLAYSGCPDTEPDDWGISWNSTIAGITAFQPCFSSQGTIVYNYLNFLEYFLYQNFKS